MDFNEICWPYEFSSKPPMKVYFIAAKIRALTEMGEGGGATRYNPCWRSWDVNSN